MLIGLGLIKWARAAHFLKVKKVEKFCGRGFRLHRTVFQTGQPPLLGRPAFSNGGRKPHLPGIPHELFRVTEA
jgi:hypothetical protein